MSDIAAIAQLRKISVDVVNSASLLKRYVFYKFGLRALGSLTATFATLVFVFDHASSYHSRLISLLPALTSFYLLFVLLGLIDDLADLQIDSTGSAPRVAPNAVGKRRLSLWGGLTLTSASIIILNFDSEALIVALCALGAMLVGDLGFKSKMSTDTAPGPAALYRWVGLALFYEGAPFLMFLYVYYAWRHSSAISLTVAAQLTITTIFWAGYEFWKYSRHITRPDWSSYGLPWQITRRYLVGILAISFASQIITWRIALLPIWFALYASVLCGSFGALLWLLSPTSQTSRTATLGYLFIVGMNVGLLAATLEFGGASPQ